jgi:hypothetical protein
MNGFARSMVTIAAAMALAALTVATSIEPLRAASPEEPSAALSAAAGSAPGDHGQPGPGAMAGHDHTGTAGGAMPGMLPQHGAMMVTHAMHAMDAMHAMHAGQMDSAVPVSSGQDAFGAIQENVARLEADPATDWSKVNLEALRQHLIDMNEVTLRADAAAIPVAGGLTIAITGSGRTLAAIQRMVPAHAQEIDGLNHWRVAAGALANGMTLTVTSDDPKEVQKIRGLGFIGILVTGSHHKPHHLAMARGESPHAH